MWNASDLPGSLGAACRRILRAGVAPLLFQIAALALSGPALAQPSRDPAPAVPAPPAEAPQDLRQILEKSYEVLPLHNGVMLRPRKERLGVRTIEVSGDTIAVNGERVTEGVLRAWLAADADPVLRLFRLPPRQRQALFGLQAGAGARPEEIPAPAGPPVAETEIPAEGELPAEAPETPEMDIPETPVPPEAPETPEAPEAPSSTTGSKINLFGGVTVEKDELAEEAVAILGTVRVEGEVSREVTAVGGSVVINGRVGGDVTAVGGNVRLGPQAVVDGDVSSVGGKIMRAKGSQIHGQTSEVGMVPPDRNDDDDDDVHVWVNPMSPFLSDTADFFWQLIWTGILGLLVCLCLLAAPGPMERTERHLAAEPWVAVLVGLLAQVAFVFLFIVVTILLVITIVGCAIIALYPFLFIALALAILLGYAATAHRFGLFLEARFGRRFGSPYAVALVGVLALGFITLLGRVVALGGGFLNILAAALLTLGFLVQYVATTMGIGGLLLARFGSSRGTLAPALPPPPPPPAPVPYDPVLDGPRPDPSDRPWEPAPPPAEG